MVGWIASHKRYAYILTPGPGDTTGLRAGACRCIHVKMRPRRRASTSRLARSPLSCTSYFIHSPVLPGLCGLTLPFYKSAFESPRGLIKVTGALTGPRTQALWCLSSTWTLLPFTVLPTSYPLLELLPQAQLSLYSFIHLILNADSARRCARP